MRQPDLNRVNRAMEHVRAANTVLNSIKWENITALEDEFRCKAKQTLRDVECILCDIINIQDNGRS